MSPTSDLMVRTSNGPVLLAFSSGGVSPFFFGGLIPSGRVLTYNSCLEFLNVLVPALGNMREDFVAVGSDEQVVLDAHASDARKVDARLNGHDHARLKFHLRVGAHQRAFVDHESKAMPDRMSEELAIARVGDDLAGGGVHFLALRARPNRLDARLLSAQHHLVNLTHLRIGALLRSLDR